MNSKPLPRINKDSVPFWAGCAANELRVQQCQECGQTQLPPRARCVDCGATALTWTAVAATGVVYSFTIVERAPTAAFKPDLPYVLALIDIVGKARLMMQINIADPHSVYIGMPVAIAFEARSDADGQQFLPFAHCVDDARKPTASDLS